MSPRSLARLKALVPAAYADLLTVVAGHVVRNGLRGVAKLLVAGFLAPRGLGILRSIYSVFKLVAALVDFGFNYAVLTLVPAARSRKQPEECDRILKSVFVLRLVVATVFVIAGWLLAGSIAGSLLGDPGLTVWVRLAFLAVIGQSLWKFVEGVLSTGQQFNAVAVFLTTAPALLLAGVALAIALGRFDISVAILLYLFVPTATAALWWWGIDRRFVRSPFSWETTRRVVRFGRWVFVSRIAMTSMGQINPLMLKNPGLSGSVAAGELNTGLYAFGTELADELAIVSESLYMVLMPRAGGKASHDALVGFVKRCYKSLAWLAPFLVLPIFVFKPFLHLLSRIVPAYLEFLPSFGAFVLLYLAGLLSLAIIPMRSALYAMELPRVDSVLEAVGVVLLIAGGIVLIPRYGYVGAAAMALAVRAGVLVGIVGYGLGKLRQQP